MTGDSAGGTPVIFLPGILMPASLRYVRLLQALGDGVEGVTKELEVYASEQPPSGYSISLEVDGISRAADAAGFERFHLYGHSAGGAIALAYAGAHPERLLSLALDEPATDFSAEDLAEMQADLAPLAGLPAAEALGAFARLQLAPGVESPPPPDGPPPPWMALRPAGIEAFGHAIQRHSLPPGALASLQAPVYYSHGSLSHPRWLAIRDRLANEFRDFRAEVYEGLHHLNTSHHAEPERVAVALRRLWS